MTLKTRNPAVARIADRTQCQWPSRSSKVNDFHVIWQGVCHFLLAINSKLGCISAQFPRYGQFSIGKHTKTHTFLPVNVTCLAIYFENTRIKATLNYPLKSGKLPYFSQVEVGDKCGVSRHIKCELMWINIWITCHGLFLRLSKNNKYLFKQRKWKTQQIYLI